VRTRRTARSRGCALEHAVHALVGRSTAIAARAPARRRSSTLAVRVEHLVAALVGLAHRVQRLAHAEHAAAGHHHAAFEQLAPGPDAEAHGAQLAPLFLERGLLLRDPRREAGHVLAQRVHAGGELAHHLLLGDHAGLEPVHEPLQAGHSATARAQPRLEVADAFARALDAGAQLADLGQRFIAPRRGQPLLGRQRRRAQPLATLGDGRQAVLDRGDVADRLLVLPARGLLAYAERLERGRVLPRAHHQQHAERAQAQEHDQRDRGCA
jgi:hypothetical protein